jgi:hypothetical protein
MMHHAHFSISWFGILVAVFAFVLFIRLVNSQRMGTLLMLVCAGVLLLYGLKRTRENVTAMVEPPALMPIAVGPPRFVVADPPPAPSVKPARPKRGPKGKPAEPGPIAPLPGVIGAPPAPPVAEESDEPGPAASSETVAVEEAPLTLYHGLSTLGRPIDSLPKWVSELAGATPGSSAAAFSSDRFASVAEAEKQLWGKARDFVARDLRLRSPEAVHWSPPPDLLKSRGFLLERCVERTAIEVGQFVEPMYRVHWKVSLSKNVRDAVADAWRPAVQERRLEASLLAFLGAAGILACVNFILRVAPCARAGTKRPAAMA